MPTSQFAADAQIANDRWRHDINNDHFGDLSDLNVVIDSPVGPWQTGTPLHFVVQDLFIRALALESSNHRVSFFYIDAYLLGFGEGFEGSPGTVTTIRTLDAVIYRVITGTCTADARFAKAFTIDAVVRGGATITVDAVVV